MTKILKMSVVLQFSLRFQSYTYINIFIFIFVCCQTSRTFRITYRIFYIVACNYSNLVILILSPSLSIGTHLLRDYHSHTFETSLQHRPYLKDVHALLKICILITVKALWPNKEIYVLIHISKTTHSIFNCGIPSGSPWQSLNFK